MRFTRIFRISSVPRTVDAMSANLSLLGPEELAIPFQDRTILAKLRRSNAQIDRAASRGTGATRVDWPVRSDRQQDRDDTRHSAAKQDNRGRFRKVPRGSQWDCSSLILPQRAGHISALSH